MNNILFIIESCQKNKHRIDALKQTWLPNLSKKFVPLVAVGDKNNSIRVDQDVLYLDCEDGYNYLTHKTYSILNWYVKNSDSKFIIIADDDIYINCNLFNRYNTFEQYDYVGRFAFGGMDKTENIECSGFASGCFYILSKRAAEYIINHFEEWMIDYYKSAEDCCIGNILNNCVDIKKYDEISIMPWSRCRYFENLMVGHYTHLKNNPELTFLESMKQMHILYNGDK